MNLLTLGMKAPQQQHPQGPTRDLPFLGQELRLKVMQRMSLQRERPSGVFALTMDF